ncbi:serine/threonine protein kinase [Nonomuraea polychroma]|uniref:non-specific serine/threonine protein kinase n=1 Tax=Nonomuraea polychroma TaxID=46176 RepID=A0A438MHZ5_9ACTN|nr:serine/threonine-protein kinase [Nonomuraea polychroma]RVX45051.1 serine/threonine protein kinase [Nonomuraea polychroma]
MDGVQALTGADPAQLGEYALVGVLSRGRQSAVYLGRSANGYAAIKLLPAADAETQRAVAAAQQVTEPSSARVLTAGMYGDRLYVVSEYVQGVPLAQVIRQEGPRDAGQLHWLATTTMAALAAMHRAGIAHLDFSPAMVLLGPEGPKVIGFGIPRPPEPGFVPAYLSPEQVAGHPAGPASDLFSWAVTMIYAGTGMSAFGEDSVAAVSHRVLHTPVDLSRMPPPLQPILDRCLAKQPEYRPTAQEVLAFLHGAVPGRPDFAGPPPAYAPSPAYAPPPAYAGPPAYAAAPVPSKSSTGLVVGLTAGIVILLAAGATAVVLLLNQRQPEPVAVATPSAVVATPPAGRVSVAGRWTGTYLCNQGKTALELTIKETSSDELEAVFAFEADPSNPGVPSGSFAMSGRLDGRVLELKGERWIDRPGEYVMVDLRATLTQDRPSTIKGTILAGGCSTFEVERS